MKDYCTTLAKKYREKRSFLMIKIDTGWPHATKNLCIPEAVTINSTGVFEVVTLKLNGGTNYCL